MTRTHAIVSGGGIAGLMAAQVLAARFDRVTLLERDAELDTRRHVPHQPHTHIFGAHGYALANRLFPGLDAKLAAGGAPAFDFGDAPVFAGTWSPRRPLGLVVRSFTRPLLERVLRSCLAPNVTVASGVRVTCTLLEAGRVVAVATEDGRRIAADFVVDACGMASRTPQLLAANGYGNAPRSEIDLGGAALTQLYRPRPSAPRDWVMMSVRPCLENQRCGAISHVEDGLWRVSVWGFGACKPGRDNQRAFATQLATPRFAEEIAGAEPVSPPYFYASSSSRWIHYEQLAAMPDGFAVLGDAAFHPNFDHAQGMTFCAMSAALLGDHLDDAELGQRPGSTLAFQQAYAALVAPWWEWNTAVEATFAKVAIEPTPCDATWGRMAAYRWVRRAAIADEHLWHAVLETNQGARLPTTLITSEVYARAGRIVPMPSDLILPVE